MKNKLIKSTFILLIGGAITKILGMIIKIVITRMIGIEGVSLYTLIMPTFGLLIALAQLGFPIAISTLVAEGKSNNRRMILGIIPVSLFLNMTIIALLVILAPFISNNLLHEPRTYYGILATGLVLPFISISSILRGYFYGKERLLPHIFSNIMEDVIRLIILIIGIPIFLLKGIEITIFFLIVSNIISECSSILIFTFCLPKKNISKNDFLPNKKYLKNILSISLPSTGSRIIGNIGSFLEPIILTTVLLKIGYSNEFIIHEYGVLNGYVLPLLLLPSFFTMAISQAIIPSVSKFYSSHNKKGVKKVIKQAIIFSLAIGIPFTILVELFPNFLLNFIYNAKEGSNYLRVFAPIFLFSYIQSPLTATLQAMNKAKCAMNGTIIGITLRTILLVIVSFFHIGIWSIIVAATSNILFVTFHHIFAIKNYTK